MLDVKTLKAIYGNDVGETGKLPYRVFADGGESYGMAGVIHVPGVKGYRPNCAPGGTYDLQEFEVKPYHGYIGLTVERYDQPIAEQPVRLCWSAIDIDAKDNTRFGTPLLIELVKGIFPEAVIRLSKSGKGLHVIFPLIPVELSYGGAREAAKQSVLHPLIQLCNVGVSSCATGLTNLWLWSVDGKQETISWPAN